MFVKVKFIFIIYFVVLAKSRYGCKCNFNVQSHTNIKGIVMYVIARGGTTAPPYYWGSNDLAISWGRSLQNYNVKVDRWIQTWDLESGIQLLTHSVTASPQRERGGERVGKSILFGKKILTVKKYFHISLRWRTLGNRHAAFFMFNGRMTQFYTN